MYSFVKLRVLLKLKNFLFPALSVILPRETPRTGSRESVLAQPRMMRMMMVCACSALEYARLIDACMHKGYDYT